jgi:RNA polymerase-binding transcription factor DksA
MAKAKIGRAKTAKAQQARRPPKTASRDAAEAEPPRPASGRAVSHDDARARLERERQAAIDELRRVGIGSEPDENDPRGLSGAVVEEGDAAQASERRDMSFAQRERLAERINTLTAALARIADGTWGRCETCGNPIEPERLAALPEARRCLRCQEELERTSGRRVVA